MAARLPDDSTRDMRRSVHERELKPKFSNQKLVEIIHEDLRALTDDMRTAKFDAATILALLGRIEATQDEMGRVMKAVMRPRAVSSEPVQREVGSPE